MQPVALLKETHSGPLACRYWLGRGERVWTPPHSPHSPDAGGQEEGGGGQGATGFPATHFWHLPSLLDAPGRPCGYEDAEEDEEEEEEAANQEDSATVNCPHDVSSILSSARHVEIWSGFFEHLDLAVSCSVSSRCLRSTGLFMFPFSSA